MSSSKKNHLDIVAQSRSVVEKSLQDSSLSSSRLSTSGRKRSLYLSDVEQDTEGPSNEYVQEKAERRLQEAAKKKLEIQEQVKQKENSASHKTPLLSTLTSEELDQHYYHCFNLFSKNKVTSHNAFKLQLIDFMKMMVVQKNERAENLTLMSCTLDASAKIYACRVDKVYNDMMKHLSENFDDNEDGGDFKEKKNKKRRKEASDNDSDEGDNEDGRTKKKKLSWPTSFRFVKKKGSFEKKMFEQAFHSANLPRGQEYFLQFPVSSSGADLVISKPLIEKSTVISCCNEFTNFDVYPGGCDNDRLVELIPGYCDLSSKMVVLEKDDETQSAENSFTYDPVEAELAAQQNIIDDNSEGMADGDADVAMDYDEVESVPNESYVCETPSASRSSGTTISGLRHSSVCLTPAALTRFLRPAAAASNEENSTQYSFFDASKLEFLAGSSHWKIKASKQRTSCTGKTPRSEAKTSRSNQLLDMSKDQVDKCWAILMDEEGGSAKKLSIKTISEWRYKVKNTWPKDLLYSQRELLSTFKKEIPFKLHTKESEALTNLNDSVMFSQHEFTNPLRDDEDGFEDGVMPLEDEPCVEDNVVGIENDISRSKSDSNVEELLKPRVQIEKNPIKFAKIQKRVDIRELKATMWSLMELESEKENCGIINSTITPKMKEKACFSEVFHQLPERLPDSMANNVSMPIAFLSMLFLANEKILHLELTRSNDVFIRLD